MSESVESWFVREITNYVCGSNPKDNSPARHMLAAKLLSRLAIFKGTIREDEIKAIRAGIRQKAWVGEGLAKDITDYLKNRQKKVWKRLAAKVDKSNGGKK